MLRRYGLPEVAPAVLNGTPLLSGPLSCSGRREFAAEVSWDLPSPAREATALLDVTVTGAQAGRPCLAPLGPGRGIPGLGAALAFWTVLRPDRQRGQPGALATPGAGPKPCEG